MDGHSKVNPVATIFLLQTMDKSKLIYSISGAKFLSTMKTKPCFLLIVLALIAGVHQSAAQEARFFQMAGPVASTITAFSADGYVTWTNAPANATFTVQTASSLFSPINWVDYIQVPVTNAVTTHRLYDPHPPAGMAFIPAGSFTMGNCMDPNEGDSDELPLHTVNVSAFYMDKYDVTKALWDDVYQWATNHGYNFLYPGSGKAANHPVQTIDWYDAAKWCNARSEKEGKTPAYYESAAQTTVYRSGQVTVDNSWVKWNVGYRLPTGGGVGEGGAERGERTAFSVGQHHFVESSELLRFSRRLRLGRESNERLSPDVRRERLSLHQSGGIFRAERVWGLRHGWEHTAVVLGLLWGIFERFADRPAWPHFRPGPYYSGRRLGRRRVLLPDGGPRQLRRGERGGLRLRIPVR